MDTGSRFRKAFSLLGTLLFVAGILISLNRYKFLFERQVNMLFSSIVGIEIPYFDLKRMDCPAVIRMLEPATVTAVIGDLSSNASVKSVSLNSETLDIAPREPREVAIPKAETSEISWTIIAHEQGIHKVSIPLNPWDQFECEIAVVGSIWLSDPVPGVFGLLGILVGSLLVVPWGGFTRRGRYPSWWVEALKYALAVLPVVVVVLIFEWLINIPTVVSVGLALLATSIWFLAWFPGTWRLDRKILPAKGMPLLFIGTFIFGLASGFGLVFLSTGDATQLLLHGAFDWIFIPCSGVLLLTPWFASSWEHPWAESSKSVRRLRVILFLFAGPFTLVPLFFALQGIFSALL